MLAIYDVESNCIRLGLLFALGVFPYKGKMVKIKNQQLDILMTPNHRCVVSTNSVPRNTWFYENDRASFNRFKLASDLTQTDNIVVNARFENLSSISIGEDVAKLLGWILSDGMVSKRRGIIITQSYKANPKYCEEIENLLRKIGIHHKIMRRNSGLMYFKIPKTINCIKSRKREEIEKNKNQWYDRLFSLIPLSWNLIWHLPANEAKALLEGLLKGDGHQNNLGEWTGFTQKNRDLMDKFQLLAMRCGYRVSIAPAPSIGSSISKKQHIGLVRKYGGVNVEIIEYDGVVWCPQVETGAFITRRNGKVFITGNSYIDHMALLCSLLKRVLKPTGGLWINMGDTHFGGGRGQKFKNSPKQASNRGSFSYSEIRFCYLYGCFACSAMVLPFGCWLAF